MGLSLPQVEELVVRSGKVGPVELRQAVAAAQHLEMPLEEILVGRRLINGEELGQLLAGAYGVSYFNLNGVEVKKEVRVLAFRLDGQVLLLAMEDPSNLETVELVRKQTGYEVKPVYTDKAGLLVC